MPRTKSLSDQDVLESTAQVLLEIGPARFTLTDVARAAGLSPATLLQRFGSKRGLLVAFAEAESKRATLPFEQARAQHESPLAALLAGLVAASHGVGSRQQIAHGLGVLLHDLTDDSMHRAAREHAKRTQQAIRQLLDQAVAVGEVPATDTTSLSLSIQAAWNGAIVQWALRETGTFHSFLTRVLAPLLPRPVRTTKAARTGRGRGPATRTRPNAPQPSANPRSRKHERSSR